MWKKYYNTVPACYHVALGKIFKKVYSFESDFYEEMKRYKMTDYSNKTKYAYNPQEHLKMSSVENGGNWAQDEIWSTDMLRKYHENGGTVITEVGIGGNRLDRSNWSYNPQDVNNGKYIDAHLPRPYSKHKNKIDSLMDLIKD